MKKFGIIIILLSFCKLQAQELTIPAQTQYLADNPFSISPTFAGIGDNARVRLNGLTQWVGIKDSPINQSLAVDFRIADRSGIGAFSIMIRMVIQDSMVLSFHLHNILF